MIWILSFYGLAVIFLLILIISEREKSEKYGLAIDYLETYGDGRYFSYSITDYERKEIIIRDTEDNLHRINMSDILLVGELKNSGIYEIVLKDNKTYKIYG